MLLAQFRREINPATSRNEQCARKKKYSMRYNVKREKACPCLSLTESPFKILAYDPTQHLMDIFMGLLCCLVIFYICKPPSTQNSQGSFHSLTIIKTELTFFFKKTHIRKANTTQIKHSKKEEELSARLSTTVGPSGPIQLGLPLNLHLWQW